MIFINVIDLGSSNNSWVISSHCYVLSSQFKLVFFNHSTSDVAKGQIKPKAGLARRRFSQKMNERICFVCCEKQKSKQNKFVPSFFGQSTARQSAFGFISSLVYVKKFRNKIPFQNSTFLLSCFENILAKKTPRVKLRHCEEATKI